MIPALALLVSAWAIWEAYENHGPAAAVILTVGLELAATHVAVTHYWPHGVPVGELVNERASRAFTSLLAPWDRMVDRYMSEHEAIHRQAEEARDAR